MKKALYTMLIVVVGLLAFVGCSPQSSVSDELVSATIVSTDRTTRALVTEVNFDINNVKAWKYTATKADKGLNTGETSEQKQLRDSTSGEPAVKGTVTDALSQGSWNFTLYGYSDEEFANLICVGSAENQLVTTEKTPITIVVKPTQSTGGKGSIVISEDIKIVNKDGTKTYESGDDYTMSYMVIKGELVDGNKIENLTSVDVGSYTVAITFKIKGTDYVVAKAEKTVNVYDNLTTTVYGTIEESLGSAKITGEGVIVAEKTETLTDTTNSSALAIAVNSTPVGADETTTVTFPASSLTKEEGNTEGAVKLTVKTTAIEKASTTYTVENSGTAVAGFELTLDGAEIASENSGITITSFIAPELDESKLSIVYKGDESEQTPAKIDEYDAETGEIKFTVYHFSEYYIAYSEKIAYDATSLSSALSLASTDKNVVTDIRIIRDIELSKRQMINNGWNVRINLNGHSIYSDDNIDLFYVRGGHAEFTGEGTVRSSLDYNKITFIVEGSSTDEASYTGGHTDYSTLVIGENVTLKGQFGIFVKGDYQNSAHGYGIKVSMKGKYVAEQKSPNATQNPININGNLADKEGNIPEIMVSGANLDGSIYFAGYAKLTIENTTINDTTDTAIEIRAGELNISSGIFKSTATPLETKANGNGSTTKGAAIAVAQHTTRLPITVNISGGEFEGYHALAVLNPEKSTLAQLKDVKVTVTGGSFKATGTKAEDGSVDVVNVDTTYFVISENPIYASNASFTVTAKTE